MQTRKIFPLSQHIIAQIAAGEVIERPAYAIKELVENAIDAKAKTITIHIENAGFKKITVIDDGEGMSKEDLLESFKLHTTSKLSSLDDLTHITTLGFRGEALASIAAISFLTIQSRQKTSLHGTKIEIKKGKIEKNSPVGMPKGTVITVDNLFHFVPARRKFLKSQPTEFRHIVSILTGIILAHPEIHFVLTHNKRTIFDLTQTENQIERIKSLLGEDVFTTLLPVSFNENHIILSGFITTPQTKTPNAQKQFIFINGRTITDKRISHAIKDAYGTLLEAKKHPVFLLSFSVPYEFVDVNIHPRKEYVKFADNNALYELITKAVLKTLAENNITFTDTRIFGEPLTHSFAGRILKETTLPWDIRLRNEIGTDEAIIQMHNVYLIMQTRFGIVLIDQHAAHERILYEQFLASFKTQHQKTKFHLSKPAILSLSLAENELLQEHLPLFDSFGFEIEPFKNNQFFIRAVPLLFQDRNPVELITELLADLTGEKHPKILDEKTAKMIAFLACKGAIKAGDKLTKKQAKDLITKLEETHNNATCPHGRPTKVIIDINQLHKMFKRK